MLALFLGTLHSPTLSVFIAQFLQTFPRRQKSSLPHALSRFIVLRHHPFCTVNKILGKVKITAVCQTHPVLIRVENTTGMGWLHSFPWEVPRGQHKHWVYFWEENCSCYLLVSVCRGLLRLLGFLRRNSLITKAEEKGNKCAFMWFPWLWPEWRMQKFSSNSSEISLSVKVFISPIDLINSKWIGVSAARFNLELNNRP